MIHGGYCLLLLSSTIRESATLPVRIMALTPGIEPIAINAGFSAVPSNPDRTARPGYRLRQLSPSPLDTELTAGKVAEARQ